MFVFEKRWLTKDKANVELSVSTGTYLSVIYHDRDDLDLNKL